MLPLRKLEGDYFEIQRPQSMQEAALDLPGLRQRKHSVDLWYPLRHNFPAKKETLLKRLTFINFEGFLKIIAD